MRRNEATCVSTSGPLEESYHTTEDSITQMLNLSVLIIHCWGWVFTSSGSRVFAKQVQGPGFDHQHLPPPKIIQCL